MKELIRRKILELRNNFPKEKIIYKSEQIKNRFFNLKEFIFADKILFYVSYNNEVDTHNIIKECISNNKHVIVPITDKKNRRLILSELRNWKDLDNGSYDILEPKKNKVKVTFLDIIDIIVVPGIAFDIIGNRIGHGLGYYDKVLQNSKKAIKIGFAFEFQLVDRIPSEEHDIKLDKIITEDRIILCDDIK